ncbi:MAG TPA: hypothetical protein VGQ53_22595 [Chitinophagaceae bacterium]|jgi:hypothetical protein|nr:hypothetical protein [Chitinophagaceae bacterium]
MSNALIFAPSFDGHRQIYVYVLSDVLTEMGFKVFVAGNLKGKISDSSYIERLRKDKDVVLIDTSVYARGGLGITSEEFIQLQEQCDAEMTIFPDADHHISLFNAQLFNKRKRLRGKTIGIFLRPFHFYKKLSFLNRLRYLKNLPSTWRTDEYLFHEYLLKQFKLIDSALYLDENFVSHHSHTHWLPDVFQSYAEGLIGNENVEERPWIDRLENFREVNNGRFVFLYFGTAQKRRGYDLLLKMALEQDACFIHCGLNDQNEKYDLDINALKKDLERNGRLLETNQYISDPDCIESFFKSATHLVLPYQDFWGSSGVMLQALGYGIPVLVPENGIMGYRVKKYNLGLTYGHGINSLLEQFVKFKALPARSFETSISEYMKYQTSGQLKKVLISVFKDSDQIVEHP